MRLPSPLSWLDAPPVSGGLSVASADDWSFVPFPLLAQRCKALAAGLIEQVERNDVVCIVGRSSERFVAGLIGAMRAGVTVSVVAPPSGLGEHRDDVRARAVLDALRPTVMIVEPDLLAWATSVAPPGTRLLDHDDLARAGERERRDARSPADPVLVQFSSGSTGAPRGVCIPMEALCANVHAIRSWLGAGPADAWASWLPVHHDMGLVGCVLAPLTGANSFRLMAPRDFLRRPERFLACFSGSGAGSGSKTGSDTDTEVGTATITATPLFALDHVVRRVSAEQLAQLDFSGWRAIVVGSERVDPAVLDRFHDLLGPRGLARSALLPAYGMAEATLVITGVRPGEPWRVAGTDGEQAVGCGRPVDGMSVRVLDDDGLPVSDGEKGEIEISGSSVASGYWGEPSTVAMSVRSTLRTGDAGFLDDGELYVIGRYGDSVKVRGRAIFAEDVELRLAALGRPAHEYAAVLGHRDGVATLVVVIEDADDEVLAHAEALLVPYAADCRIEARRVPAAFIPRTPSGKKQRRALWNDLDRLQLAEKPA